MALMGFMTGALGDVMRRREESRLEEATARKEARLAAIRAEERQQDFAQRKELTQAELAQRAEMARQEMAGREKLTTMEVTSREKISAADNAARLQANREDNATRLAANRGGGGGGGSRSPEIKSYINEATGKVVTFDVNNASDLARLKQWQQSQPVKPYYASSTGGGAGKPPAAPSRPQPTTQPAPRAAVPAGGPRPGDVMDGYRFKGGNPANQASWEPI